VHQEESNKGEGLIVIVVVMIPLHRWDRHELTHHLLDVVGGVLLIT